MSELHIVGVLNVTPDSYFDGGKFVEVEAAVERVQELLDQGADSIDVGGESTGPGSQDVSIEEELQRVIPVIEAIKSAFPTADISVDTYKSAVAEAAISAGATMINDVTAGRGDDDMFSVVAKHNVKYVMMYSKDSSARTTTNDTDYDDVIGEIVAFLLERKQQAIQAGVEESRIIVDPGMGHFISAKPEYSMQVLGEMLQIVTGTGSPVFVSPSRKSFLAGEENLPPADRLPGTIAASAIAVANGATYVRTHDVLEVRRGCEVARSILATQAR